MKFLYVFEAINALLPKETHLLCSLYTIKFTHIRSNTKLNLQRTGLAKKNCTLRQSAIAFFLHRDNNLKFLPFFTTIYCVAV